MHSPAPAIQGRQVAAGDAGQRDEVVGLPEAIDVGLAPAGAAAQRPRVRARITDLDRGPERRVRGTAGNRPLALRELEPPAAKPPKAPQQRSSCERAADQPQRSIEFGSSGSTLSVISSPTFSSYAADFAACCACSAAPLNLSMKPIRLSSLEVG
jgi:hypothetical protein